MGWALIAYNAWSTEGSGQLRGDVGLGDDPDCAAAVGDHHRLVMFQQVPDLVDGRVDSGPISYATTPQPTAKPKDNLF